MNKIVGVLEKVKDIFTCGKKRRRGEESSFDEDIIFAIKKRRLSHSAQKKKKDRFYSTHDNTYEINLLPHTNDHKANLFYLSPYKLNLQTEILQGNNEEKNFLAILTKRCREWNKKLNLNSTFSDEFNIYENVNFNKLENKNTDNFVEKIDLLKDEADSFLENKNEENKSSILVQDIHIHLGEEKEWDANIPKAPEIKFDFINLSVKNVIQSELQTENKEEKEKEKSEPDSSDSSYSGCENVETKSEKEDDSKKLINEYETLVTSIKLADEDNKNIPIFEYDKFLKFRK